VNDLNIYRVMQILGGLLVLLMVILLRTVPATDSTHVLWFLAILVGTGVFIGARWLDERSR